MAPQVLTHPEARPIRRSLMNIKRMPVAGDPFYAAAHHLDERLCACLEGWVYLGPITLAEEGEEEEVIEAVPYVRCAKAVDA
jgi:hypothetical protein